MSEAAVEPTPEELRAILNRRTGPLEALVGGVRLAGRTAAVGVPFVLLFAGVSAGVGWLVIDAARALVTMEPAMAELGMQVSAGIAAFLGLFGIIQFSKRERASRASWWPVLLFVPAALIAISFAVSYSGQARQLGALIAGLPLTAWNRAGHAATRDQSVSLGEVIGELQTRSVEVAGPHGARIQAVAVGMQVIVPGIFYMLQLAFADMVAVLEPDKPALRRSGQLTFGMRGRLFRMILLWFVLVQGLSLGLTLGIEGIGDEGVAGRITQLIMDPAGFSFASLVAQEIVWALGNWLLTLALLVLYLEREDQVRAKSALKRLSSQGAKASE